MILEYTSVVCIDNSHHGFDNSDEISKLSFITFGVFNQNAQKYALVISKLIHMTFQNLSYYHNFYPSICLTAQKNRNSSFAHEFSEDTEDTEGGESRFVLPHNWPTSWKPKATPQCQPPPRNKALLRDY